MVCGGDLLFDILRTRYKLFLFKIYWHRGKHPTTSLFYVAKFGIEHAGNSCCKVFYSFNALCYYLRCRSKNSGEGTNLKQNICQLYL